MCTYEWPYDILFCRFLSIYVRHVRLADPAVHVNCLRTANLLLEVSHWVLTFTIHFWVFFWVNVRLNGPRPKPKAAICANSTSKYPIFTWKEGKACLCVCCIRRLLQAYDISDYNKSFGRLCSIYLYLHWNEQVCLIVMMKRLVTLLLGVRSPSCISSRSRSFPFRILAIRRPQKCAEIESVREELVRNLAWLDEFCNPSARSDGSMWTGIIWNSSHATVQQSGTVRFDVYQARRNIIKFLFSFCSAPQC